MLLIRADRSCQHLTQTKPTQPIERSQPLNQNVVHTSKVKAREREIHLYGDVFLQDECNAEVSWPFFIYRWFINSTHKKTDMQKRTELYSSLKYICSPNEEKNETVAYKNGKKDQ